jgi:hypothetical protein
MGKEYGGELQLASKGHFYDVDWDGVLHVEPWGTKEEQLLVSPNINFTETLSRLVTRLTDCPVAPEKLLLSDRQMLFIYMRCLSYGSDYSFNYRCEDCEERVQHDMDLEKDLDITFVDDPEFLETLDIENVESLVEPFSLELPLQGKTLGWRQLRGVDERAVDKYVRRMAKGMKKAGPKDERSDYVYRAALRIETVDGNKVDIREAIEMAESLKGQDSLAFRQAIEAISIGIDPELEISCRNCGYLNEVFMPMDKGFFRPKRRVA